MGDYYLAAARGLVEDHYPDQKFAHAPNGIQTTRTSIWARADGTGGAQQLWVPPTAARIHQITSTSGNDTSAGTGARTVRVWGLLSWTQTDHETFEDITMNGTSNVPTTNAYVIIHRIRVTSNGTSRWNEGDISATADTDGTVTAQMPATQGSTQLAVKGIPSGWQAFIYRLTAEIGRASSQARTATFSVEDWEMSDPSNININVRDELNPQSTGTNSISKKYEFPLRFTGPCIIHITAISSANDVDGAATFNHITVPDI